MASIKMSIGFPVGKKTTIAGQTALKGENFFKYFAQLPSFK